MTSCNTDRAVNVGRAVPASSEATATSENQSSVSYSFAYSQMSEREQFNELIDLVPDIKDRRALKDGVDDVRTQLAELAILLLQHAPAHVAVNAIRSMGGWGVDRLVEYYEDIGENWMADQITKRFRDAGQVATPDVATYSVDRSLPLPAVKDSSEIEEMRLRLYGLVSKVSLLERDLEAANRDAAKAQAENRTYKNHEIAGRSEIARLRTLVAANAAELEKLRQLNDAIPDCISPVCDGKLDCKIDRMKRVFARMKSKDMMSDEFRKSFASNEFGKFLAASLGLPRSFFDAPKSSPVTTDEPKPHGG